MKNRLLYCPHCKHTGTDVVIKPKYCGGQGLIPVTMCENETACWRRWDRQHGFHRDANDHLARQDHLVDLQLAESEGK